MKEKNSFSIFGLILNGLIFISCVWLAASFFLILPTRLKMWNKQKEFRVGTFVVEGSYARGNSYKGSTCSLIGKVNNQEKKMSCEDHNRRLMDKSTFAIGSTHPVWFHDNFKSVFYKDKNLEHFVLPKLVVKQIYDAFILWIPFLVLVVFKLIWNKRRRKWN